LGRPLDVREEEGDGADRQLASRAHELSRTTTGCATPVTGGRPSRNARSAQHRRSCSISAGRSLELVASYC
jgi:hypothetical protein